MTSAATSISASLPRSRPVISQSIQTRRSATIASLRAGHRRDASSTEASPGLQASASRRRQSAHRDPSDAASPRSSRSPPAAVAFILAVVRQPPQLLRPAIYVRGDALVGRRQPAVRLRPARPRPGRARTSPIPRSSALLLRPFGALPLGATIAIFTVGTVAAIALTTWWLITPVADRRDLPRWYAARPGDPAGAARRAEPGDDHLRADQHAARRADPGRPADRRTAQLALGRRRHRARDGAQAVPRHLHRLPDRDPALAGGGRGRARPRPGRRCSRRRSRRATRGSFWTVDAVVDRAGGAHRLHRQPVAAGHARPAGRAGASRRSWPGCSSPSRSRRYGLWRAARAARGGRRGRRR